MFRTRRQARFQKLRGIGFLAFEARALSKVSIKAVPYVRQMIKDRAEALREFKREGATRQQWETYIKGLYSKNRWLTAGRRRIQADPWKMLRDYESRHRARQPEYESPWEKRQRDWQNFIAKLERTMRQQKGLAWGDERQRGRA